MSNNDQAIPLQMMLTGMLMGACQIYDFIKLDVEPVIEDGHYRPWFFITGQRSGVRLKVEVSVVEGES